MESNENEARAAILAFVIDDRPAYGFPKPRKYRGAPPRRLSQAERDLDKFAEKVRGKPIDELRVSLKRGGFKRSPKPKKTADGKRRGALARRLKSYGLTEAAYQAMLDAQDHRCLLCTTPISEARQLAPARGGRPGYILVSTAETIAIDHCHATGKVRGLLCMLCNRGLGDFKDDPDRLRRAADYLEAHR